MNDLEPIATVNWKELQRYIHEVDGSWRDIYVFDASRADWKVWADFVNANYRVKFTDANSVRHSQIDFVAVESFWDGHGQANFLTVTFFMGEIPIRCHFFSDTQIENDIDPRKITSYAVHQQLMDYLMRLSQALGKEVVVTAENDTPATCFPHWMWQLLLAVNGEQMRIYPYWFDATCNYPPKAKQAGALASGDGQM